MIQQCANIIPFRTWSDEPVKAVDLPSMRDVRPIARIQAIVALSYGIELKEMKSDSRRREIAWPRQVAMYLSRQFSHLSLPMIGYHFGHRDHSTVIHAIKAVEQRMDADPIYRGDVEALRAALG